MIWRNLGPKQKKTWWHFLKHHDKHLKGSFSKVVFEKMRCLISRYDKKAKRPPRYDALACDQIRSKLRPLVKTLGILKVSKIYFADNRHLWIYLFSVPRVNGSPHNCCRIYWLPKWWPPKPKVDLSIFWSIYQIIF